MAAKKIEVYVDVRVEDSVVKFMGIYVKQDMLSGFLRILNSLLNDYIVNIFGLTYLEYVHQSEVAYGSNWILKASHFRDLTHS